MNIKKIVSVLVIILLMFAYMPNFGVGSVHSHALEYELEYICEHNFMSVVHNGTCEKDGYTEFVCTKMCGTSYIDQFSIVKATGHTPDSDGICEKCGKNLNAAPGDLNSDGLFAAADLVVMREVLMSTQNDDDVLYSGDCDGSYTADLKDMVRLKKHIANDIGESAFEYEVDKNGNAVITGFDKSVSGAVTIPASIGGYTVSAIGEGVFEDCAQITSVLIPNTVKAIEDNAFSGCNKLKGTALPDSIKTIGDYAFAGCSSMTAMRLSKNTEEIGDSAFKHCSSLIEINLPEKVTVLENSAFYGCSQLVFIGLPENLKEIKTYTFYGCEKLESVSIPITVVEIGNNAFDSCESLLSVVIPYETAFGENVFSNCSKLTVKGYAGTGGIDAAVNSGANYELMDCGHSQFVLLYAVNPSCSESGYSGDKYCINCGKIEVKGTVIPQTAHLTELKNYKEVTCTQDGYTGDTVCTLCNLYLDRGSVVECTGHYAEGMESLAGYVAPTCTRMGCYGQFTCEKCNKYIEDEVILPKGHKTYYKNQTVASCVKDGYTGDLTCRVCQEVLEKGKTIPKGNHTYALYGYKKATCTADGYSGDWKCVGCGIVETPGSVIPKGHTPVTNNYKAATCTEKGYSGDSKCNDCGIELSKGQELPLLGHLSVLINYKEATCEEDGYTGDQLCSRCEVLVTVGKPIDKLGHKIVIVNKKDCTETENGYTGDRVCERCGETVEEGKVIPANHKHTMNTVGYKDSTCTETGFTGNSTCTECGYSTEGEIIPLKAHEISTTVIDATCDKGGYTIDECNNCDYEKKYNVVDALGHDWDTDWSVEKPATCTEDGKQIKNCSRCDEKQTETIKATGHTEGERTGVKAPTCEENGYTGDCVCTVCGETIFGATIEPTGHNYSDWAVRCFHSENSDDDMSGGIGDDMVGGDFGEGEITEEYTEEYRVCSICKKEETNRIADSQEMYDVTYGEGSCTSSIEVNYACKHCDFYKTVNESFFNHLLEPDTSSTAPTCTTEGYQHSICSRCGYKETTTIPALGHNYEDGQCTICGKIEKIESITIATDHNYANSEYEEWKYTFDKAESVSITFSDNSVTEAGFDIVYVYDVNDTIIAKYSGYEMSGQTVTVSGDTIKVVFTSDSSYNMYGFEAVITPNFLYCSCGKLLCDFEVIQETTCMQEGVKIATCENCGEENTIITPMRGEHLWDSDSGQCIRCGEECCHEPDEAGGLCNICGKPSCPNCWGDFSHDAANCPNMGGMHCGACGGTDHVDGDPMCPVTGGGFWCDYCQIHHMDPMECPMMGGGGCPICGAPDHYAYSPEECPMMMG